MTEEMQQKRHFERPTSTKQYFPTARIRFYFIGMIFISLVAGALGFTIVASFYPTFDDNIFFYRERQPIIVGADEQPLASFINTSDQALVSIFFRRQRLAGDAFDQLPEPTLFIGNGVVATSDGWIITEMSSLNQNRNYEVFLEGEIYPVSEVINDTYTGFSFIKIDSKNLTAIAFTDSFPFVGEQLLFNNGAQFKYPRSGRVHVGQTQYKKLESRTDHVRSSKILSSAAQIISPYSDEMVAPSVMFTAEGKFAGVTKIQGGQVLLVPAPHLRLSLENLLSGLVDLDFGVWYYNNEINLALPDRSGIVIFHPTRQAVLSNSIAAKNNIQTADVITFVNSEQINSQAPFEYLWRKYQHKKVRLQIMRDGENITVDVELQ
jgi:S1-C subfamily serine protease